MPEKPLSREPHHQLDKAVAEVFTVMLNLACVPAAGSPAITPPCLTASILFSGTLDGFCALQIDQPTAAAFTANLTGLPKEQLAPELFADTAGELCNMIAGSWKAHLPRDRAACHLSCPTVTSGAQADTKPFQQAVTRTYLCASRRLTLHLAFN